MMPIVPSSIPQPFVHYGPFLDIENMDPAQYRKLIDPTHINIMEHIIKTLKDFEVETISDLIGKSAITAFFEGECIDYQYVEKVNLISLTDMKSQELSDLCHLKRGMHPSALPAIDNNLKFK